MRRLLSIQGFFPYTLMLFLNAFVDLGHKIVIQNTIFKIYDGQQQIMLTAIVNALILLPYIFLFSPAGFLSDKFPKHKVMLYCALVEVITVTLVIVCYYRGWFWSAFTLTLLMAMQSAIYSPAKYGYIRELVGDEWLAQANGVVQAVTIVAILGGTLVFSALFEWMLGDLELIATGQILQVIYPLGFLILLLALIEFVLAFLLPEKRPVNDDKRFALAAYFGGRYLQDNIRVITHIRLIWLAIVGLLAFWATSQVVLAIFPAFAKAVLGETNTFVIQGILACTAIGIMAGSLFAGRVSKNALAMGLIPAGIFGFSLLVGVIPRLDSAVAMAGVFMLSGFFGGIFIVPLTALMQYLSPADELGTVLAGNNWMQNIAMFVALALTITLAWYGLDSVGMFYLLMLASLLFAVYLTARLPHTFASLCQKLCVWPGQTEIMGFAHLPRQGGVLLAGDFYRWSDFLLVQIACPGPVHVVLFESQANPQRVGLFCRAIYRWFAVRRFSAEAPQAGYQCIDRILQQGGFACVQWADLAAYKQWRESSAAPLLSADIQVVPFYLALADDVEQQAAGRRAYRQVHIIIGQPASLQEKLHTLQLHLSALPFQWRRFIVTGDATVFLQDQVLR